MMTARQKDFQKQRLPEKQASNTEKRKEEMI